MLVCAVNFILLLSFVTSQDTCGSVLNAPSGIINSPNFPNDYPANSNCVWKIEQPENHKIEIEFHVLDIEFSDECRYDALGISNVIDGTEEPIGRYCGGIKPGTLLSKGNVVHVTFTSDSGTAGRGFNLTYTSKSEVSTTTTTTTTTSKTSDVTGGSQSTSSTSSTTPSVTHGGSQSTTSAPSKPPTTTQALCDFIIRDSSGSIESPNYPTYYPTNAECSWRIERPKGDWINLNFLDLDVEFSNECRYDSVELLSVQEDVEKSIAKYCGELRPTETISTGNIVFIRFKSDGSGNGRGFQLQYAATSCNHIFTEPTGRIESPNYPKNYANDAECSWTIQRPKGEKINVEFLDFEVEDVVNCTHDSVKIFTVIDNHEEVFGVYCGSEKPSSLAIESNPVRIEFRTDHVIAKRGFAIQYSASAQPNNEDPNAGKTNDRGFRHAAQSTLVVWVSYLIIWLIH